MSVIVPSLAASAFWTPVASSRLGHLVMVLLMIVCLSMALHWLWWLLIPRYRRWSKRSTHIRAEIIRFQEEIACVFNKYPKRRKGERFKQAYGIVGKSVRELEEALSVGMFRERREIFVTAFMQKGRVARVTASIGSPFRCSPADNPARWKYHVEKLDCDEIRQYHNHPVHNGRTQPSPADVESCRALKILLRPHGSKLRSLIICWNDLREWKVFEYDEVGQNSLHFEYDVELSGRIQRG